MCVARTHIQYGGQYERDNSAKHELSSTAATQTTRRRTRRMKDQPHQRLKLVLQLQGTLTNILLQELLKIKIMSYNVWSLEIEDFQINKRMDAIGGLIKQHSPDIIFLQEMTPLIYCAFKSCDWWQLYECSVPPEKATRNNFCMQKSKLPVEKFYHESLENSTTGRGLCVAQIDSHKNSEERMSQANKALSSLSKFHNVVFGSDMNWNESSDGRFPMFGEWHDAWSVLRPGEDGYTYDTKSNPMLKHTGYLQRRLDRFICKLKDYEVKKIDMIGTKAIPGIYFHHNGQRLPILPSDHYGLILTICPKQTTW